MVMPVLKRLMTVVVALALVVLTACGGGGPTLPPDASPELVIGQEIYRQRCQSCHGSNGGGGIGPSVREIETRLDDQAQVDVVVNGRKNMPRFDSVLTAEEIAAVVRYTREIL